MNSSTGMKVLVGVLALIAIALSVELYRTKAEIRTPKEFEGVLTSEPPGSQLAVKIRMSGDQISETSPDRETYTVEPSIEYKELIFNIKTIGVQGQILTGKLQRTR